MSGSAALHLSITSNESVGRTIVTKVRVGRVFKLRKDTLREDFAEFDSPLIERVDVPDGSLGEDTVLVQSHQSAERCRREPLGQDQVRRTISLENPVWYQPTGRAFSFHHVRGFAEGQGFGLGKNIRQQDVVMTSNWRQGAGESNEITGDQARALVNELVKRVLSVGPGFAPENGAGVIGDLLAVEGHMFSVALHG